MTELFHLSAAEIAREVRAQRLSALEVADAHIHRVDAVNPAINAVVDDMRETARDAAREIDAQIARGDDPGPLAGVPVTIKVNADQAGRATTNGLCLQKDLIARADSPFVAHLRRASAVFVGRTNTPAFSMRWFTKNNLHGQTFNPRDRALTPGGSSGGAGAAVAAGICAIAHGTDIAGSVRYPAYACGVHGLRPSLGRVPAHNATSGDRSIGAQLMAVSGPLARRIEDVELAFGVMSRQDPMDPGAVQIPMDPRGFEKRAALCLTPDGLDVVPPVRAALLEAARTLAAAGWRIEETGCPPLWPAARINTLLWMAETGFGHGAAIETEADEDAKFVYRMMCEDVGAIDVDAMMTALKDRVTLMREWERFLRQFPVLLCPVSGELPFAQQLDVRSEADFERVFRAQLTQRALPVMGMPALAVATAADGGPPMGVQLVSGRFREDILFAAARVIEAVGPAPDVAEPTWGSVPVEAPRGAP